MLYVHTKMQDHISRFAKQLGDAIPKEPGVIIRINNVFHNKGVNEGNNDPYSTLSIKNTSYRKAIFCKVKRNGQIDTDWCNVNPNKPAYIAKHYDQLKIKSYQNQDEMIKDIPDMIQFLLDGKHVKEHREKIKVVSSRQNLTQDVVYGSEIKLTFLNKEDRIFVLMNGDKVTQPVSKMPKLKSIHPGYFYVENIEGAVDVVNKTKLSCLYVTE